MNALKKTTAEEIRGRLQEPPAFGHFADLTGRLITEPLDLSGLVLCGFDFSGSRFEGELRFGNATCKGISWFRGAQFVAQTDFRSACFFNDTRFDGAVFEGIADFGGAEFRGIATFDGCSAHARLGEPIEGEARPVLEMGPETYTSVVVPRREGRELVVERLY